MTFLLQLIIKIILNQFFLLNLKIIIANPIMKYFILFNITLFTLGCPLFLIYILKNREEETISTLFLKICNVVYCLVMEYFITFRYCWTVILIVFDNMMSKYMCLLEFMMSRMLTYPTSAILCGTSVILLYIVKDIIRDIIPFPNKKIEYI